MPDTQITRTPPTGVAANARVYPFPADFWSCATVRAIDPQLAYVGPLPQGDQPMFDIVRQFPSHAYVYVICSDLETLYVGKTVNPVGRFSVHRSRRPWWPSSGRLVLLAVDGSDRRDAEAAALYLEKIAIRVLRPLENIAGVII